MLARYFSCTLAAIAATAMQVEAGEVTPKKTFGLGLTAYTLAPEYEGTNDAVAGLTAVYHGDYLTVDHDRLFLGKEWGTLRNIQVGLLAERQHFGYDSDSSDIFAGMEDRDEVWGLGLRASVASEFGVLVASALANVIDDDEVVNASSGKSWELRYGYPLTLGNWSVEPRLGYRWQSTDVIDYLYGVQTAEATATRAAYRGRSGGTAYVGVEIESMLTEDLRLRGGASFNALPDAIGDSPLVDDDTVFRANLGLAWMF